MKTFSIAQSVEKARIESGVPFLAFLDVQLYSPDLNEVVDVMHVVLNDEDVVYQGLTYRQAIFDLSVTKGKGESNQVTLSVVDYDSSIQRMVDPLGGAVGSVVTLTICAANALDDQPELVEVFEVLEGDSSGYEIQWKLGAENALTKVFPRRRQMRTRCGWRYKGPDCGYTGSKPSCDLTLKGENGCRAHNNARRFGGFPGINTSLLNR
tara:strand:+ start:701 stop:1327 length:627 start_codon:yes stop_codon:yes gene_type:complete